MDRAAGKARIGDDDRLQCRLPWQGASPIEAAVQRDKQAPATTIDERDHRGFEIAADIDGIAIERQTERGHQIQTH